MEAHRTRSARRTLHSMPTSQELDHLLRERLEAAGVLSREQLAEATELSQTLVALGESHALGDLLITLGYVPPEVVVHFAPAGYRLAHLASETDPSPASRLSHGLRFLRRLI